MPPRFPRRPTRLDWLFDNVEPVYFITFNTWRRTHLLAREEVHETFRAFCERAQTEFNVAVGRYVLMPDHVHFFVHMAARGNPAGAMSAKSAQHRGQANPRARNPETALAGGVFRSCPAE